ncbi:hypothetical protein BT69DRAFT_1337886, partial [Atractiella rhizophila]
MAQIQLTAVAATSPAPAQFDAQSIRTTIDYSSLNPAPNALAKQYIENLSSYGAPPAKQESVPPFPRKRLAAVLVLLSINENGDLQVTLTTRSKKLRSHPGETALPGGKVDEIDATVRETALREAHEEIGLPLPPSSPLLYLTTLPATTSRTLLVVIPVVYLLASTSTSPSTTILSSLQANPDEVDAIFHLPLLSLLSFSPHSILRHSISSVATATVVAPAALEYSYQDLTWLSSRPYRLHRFASPSPSQHTAITGLTADILITTCLVALHCEEDESIIFQGLGNEVEEEETEFVRLYGFRRHSKGQLRWEEIVRLA